MGRPFEIRRETDLPATPDAVFAAVTDGTAGWLFPVPQVEHRQGGRADDGTVAVVWEPPRHVVVRTEGDDGFYNQLDFLIEARDGGTAHLTYVHSGILEGDWDTQYDGAATHTDFYLHTLGEYLRHFAPRQVTYIAGEGPAAAMADGSFARLTTTLGVDASTEVGAPVRLAVPGIDPVDAVVDFNHGQFLGLRSDDALYRFFGREPWGMPVGFGHHLFAPTADGAKAQQAWQDWLEGLYA